MTTTKHPFAPLHNTMAGCVQRGEVPGLVALVSHHGEIHVDAIGKTSLTNGEPMRRDTIFRITSMTKPVTAAAAMILVDEGQLHLDDPVDSFLPELANRRVLRHIDGPLEDTVPAERPITLRDLLTFTFGFGLLMVPPGTYPIQQAAARRFIRMGSPRPQEQPAPDKWMRRFGQLPLMHQPGEKWMYDMGSEILGVLIARASGQSFDAFLRDRIFRPLGMADTAFSVPPEKLHRFLPVYSIDAHTGALTPSDPIDGQWSIPPAFPSGGAGLVSTVDDFHAFAQMLLHCGIRKNHRILSHASAEAMTIDQLTDQQKANSSSLTNGYFKTHSWGFGVATVTQLGDPENTQEPVDTYGWNGGFGTVWRTSPREQIISILMTQCAWSSPKLPNVARDFLASVYSCTNTA